MEQNLSSHFVVEGSGYKITFCNIEGNTVVRIGFKWVIKGKAEAWAQSSVNIHFCLTWGNNIMKSMEASFEEWSFFYMLRF